MSERTKLGLGVLEAALLLGLLGDVLLRAGPWGVNVLLWVAALAAATVTLARQGRVPLARGAGWLLPAVLLFAAAFAWRDSPVLRALDLLAILAALALLSAAHARALRPELAGVTAYAYAAITSGLNAMFGAFPLLFADVRWKEMPRDGWKRHALSVGRGLALAVPLLLVFGALFSAADAVYEGLVRRTFAIDADIMVTHVLLFLFFSWVTAGFLRGTFLSRAAAAAASVTPGREPFVKPPEASVTADVGPPAVNPAARSAVSAVAADKEDESAAPPSTRHAAEKEISGAAHESSGAAYGGAAYAGRGVLGLGGPPTGVAAGERVAAGGNGASSSAALSNRAVSLGVVEVGVVLGLLDVLFFSFVMVQLRYFFGGAGVVLDSAGLTYAEYARRGFFELVWVAALVLPLLLAAHWLLRKERPAHERIFRVLAGVQILLLFVIMASAVQRMRLYQGEYGQTELRLYTTAFMGWLALVFVWFALTVLRGQRERFACGALVAGLFVVGALHLVNPDALIVRTNVRLADAQRHFDAAYAAGLSADAVPALVEALPAMPEQDRSHVACRLLDMKPRWERADWRSWNWSRAEARRLVSEHEATLREWAAPRSADAMAVPAGDVKPPE